MDENREKSWSDSGHVAVTAHIRTTEKWQFRKHYSTFFFILIWEKPFRMNTRMFRNHIQNQIPKCSLNIYRFVLFEIVYWHSKNICKRSTPSITLEKTDRNNLTYWRLVLISQTHIAEANILSPSINLFENRRLRWNILEIRNSRKILFRLLFFFKISFASGESV